MTATRSSGLSRRAFCLCCLASGGFAATSGLSTRQAFADARGLVSLIKDSAATSPIVVHKLRNNISALEGSGGNIAVLTGPDGKVLVDAGIGVSRPQLMKALTDLGPEPVSTLINTHWHFDHTDGNTWLNSVGAKIIAQDNTRKYLGEVQRVEDWDYNFLPAAPGGMPTETFADALNLKLNGVSLELKRYAPAQTDSDISVNFAEANIVHVAIRSGMASTRLSTIQPPAASTARSPRATPILRRRRQKQSSSPGMVSLSATNPSSKSSAICWSACGRMSRR
jgi:Metallo-beta-lactamase superfamily